MKEVMEPDAIDRCILELAGESGLGGVVGRHIRMIITSMLWKGIQGGEVNAALEILRKRGWVKTSHSKTNNPLDDQGTLISITTEGRDALRRLRATTQFNVRVPKKVLEELANLGHGGESTSALAIQALTEWVRMAKFPGIDFRWTPTGRKPHVTGTGLNVWEVYHIWRDHGENVEKLLKHYPHLSATQVNLGVAYAKDHVDEMPTGEFGTKPSFAREVKV